MYPQYRDVSTLYKIPSKVIPRFFGPSPSSARKFSGPAHYSPSAGQGIHKEAASPLVRRHNPLSLNPQNLGLPHLFPHTFGISATSPPSLTNNCCTAAMIFFAINRKTLYGDFYSDTLFFGANF